MTHPDDIRLILLNDQPLNEMMHDYAAANPDDLAQAAEDFCDRVLGPIFTEIASTLPPRRNIPTESALKLLREVLPTGQDYMTVDMVQTLMKEAIE